MKNLVVDAGNHRIKVAFFENRVLIESREFTHDQFVDWAHAAQADHFILSTVRSSELHELNLPRVSGKAIYLHPGVPVPVQVAYNTPETLGTDRLAAACGAAARFPRQNCLVIDLGTCINYEWITADNVYQGGAISPGMAMRFKAMHEQTARLPLAEAQTEAPLIGRSTLTCLQSGVMNGIAAELAGIIAGVEKQCTGPLHVILCGGDARVFENQLKPPIFVAPNLVLEGLNSILEHNVAT